MGLFQKLYVYLVVIPSALLFNLFARVKYFLNPDAFKNKVPGSSALTEGWVASNKHVAAVLRSAKYQATLEASKGGQAIDVDLYDLQNKTTVRLLDFMKTNRPLVVNFGSCTWPPFMTKVKDFGALCGEYQDFADFVTVYIAEAHPYDSGDLAETYEWKISTHSKFEDRIAAAKQLQTKFKSMKINSPMYVDFMEDQANAAYGALPERMYIILNGKIEYMGGIGPFGYKIHEVADWLENYQDNL